MSRRKGPTPEMDDSGNFLNQKSTGSDRETEHASLRQPHRAPLVTVPKAAACPDAQQCGHGLMPPKDATS